MWDPEYYALKNNLKSVLISKALFKIVAGNILKYFSCTIRLDISCELLA